MPGTYYALLVSVSKYAENDLSDLPAGKMDLFLMRSALTQGLCFQEDQIRLLGENGCVSLAEFGRALKEFADLLCEGDTFVLYFSGHGTAGRIHFSDGALGLESAVEFISKMKAGRKLLILDACYAGNVRTSDPVQVGPEDPVSAFAGKGIAVMAASAPDEKAWLVENGHFSRYTGAVCTAMLSKSWVQDGRKSVAAINEEVRGYMRNYARDVSENGQGLFGEVCGQRPYFHADIVGTFFFQVSGVEPYRKEQAELSVDGCELWDVRSLSTRKDRRLTAFFISGKKYGAAEIARATREAAAQLKGCSVYRDVEEERQFRDVPARVIWCYFGQDRMDMLESTYYAYGLWCTDEEVTVWENPSYELIRKMRERDVLPAEEYRKELDLLLRMVVNQAEPFLADLRRWLNGEIGAEALRDYYGDWYRDVYRAYNRLMDLPAPPEELHKRSDVVTDLAGWVLNLGIPLDPEVHYDEEALNCLLVLAMERYYEALEKLRRMEVEAIPETKASGNMEKNEY